MYSTSLSSIDARFRMRQAAVALLVILCSLPIQLTAQSTPPREGSPASNKRVNAEHGVMLREISPEAAPANPLSILGDTVEIQYRYPNMNTLYGITSTGVVSSEGVRMNLFENQEVVVLPNSVVMIDLKPSGTSFQGADFNGVSIRDVTNPYAFGAVVIGVDTNIAGFSLSSVSVNSDGLLFVNYEGLEIPAGSFARVGFFKPASSSSATKAVK
jgi:hypothetical protein